MPQAKPRSPNLSHDAVLAITRSVEGFDNLMSPLPFLWFMFGICNAANTIYGFIRNSSDYMRLLFAMHDYLPPILVVFSIIRVFEKVTSVAASSCRLVSSNKSLETGDRLLLLLELYSLKDMQLTGMGFFCLNKQFLLAFVGAALTYAVLIAGITKE